ncbi:hypothetical protein GCM10023088_80530 [Actinomadura verrucosospora]
MGGGGIEQRPDEEDGVDAHERLADNGGIREVADHGLHSGTRRDRTAHKAPDMPAMCLETGDDLPAEIAGRAGDQDR